MSGQLTALLAAILWLQANAVPTGNHTCTGVVKHPVNVLVNVTEPVTFRSYTWCLRVPPRCSKYTVQLKDRVKLHVEMHNKTITVCCEDYVEMEGRCVPACPKGADCPFMRCNRTNHCHCTPGYTGLYCNDACPRGLWGKDCKRPCDCPSGYTCHHLTGDCFVDDRPPRRTTTPTTTTTTTTTTRPTTSITTPTTESTTLETVKTPVFRFPPPPWVDTAADSKKTTTRQVKKDEAPPTKEMEVIQETYEVTTKKEFFEMSLMPNKPSFEKPTIDLLIPFSNEENVTAKVINYSTKFKKLDTIAKLPILPVLSTTPSKPIEISTDVSQGKDVNLIKKGTTALKEMTTPILTSPTPKFRNTLEQHIVTTESPLHIDFAIDHKNKTLASDTVFYTSAPSADTDPTYSVTTKVPNIVTLRPSYKETASTHRIVINTKPIDHIDYTIENKIKIVDTSTNNPTTENIVQTPTTREIFLTSPEPKSSINLRFSVPSIESPGPTAQTTMVNENISEKEQILVNQHRPTTPVFITTQSTHLEEKHYRNTLSDLQEFPENSKTESTPLASTLNNKTPFTLIQGLSVVPSSSTSSNISIPPPSNTQNHGNSRSNIFSTTTATISQTHFNHIEPNSTVILSPPLIHLTTEAKTASNLLLTTVATDTEATTVIPTTIKSLIIPTTTIKPQTVAALTTRPESNLPTTIIASTASKVAETTIPELNITYSTSPPSTSSIAITPKLSSTTEPTTITAYKTDSPPTTTKIMESEYTVQKEMPENENHFDITESQTKEKELATIPMPALTTELLKDLNNHKKLKTDNGSYSGQDKSKKKHEKTKPKNLNAKEFPSIYQTKTEKHNETIVQITTEISLRSILQAETFRPKIITTKSPTPTKMQPLPELNLVTDKRPSIETVNAAPASSKPKQIWYSPKKQNSSNTDWRKQEQSDILKEVSEASESKLFSTEMNKVVESNTIDYRQSSEEPMKKVLALEEETNYSLTFNRIKFNMTESVAAGVRLPKEEGSYIHLPMILVLGLALVTLLLLTLTLWVYLKRRRQRAQPFPPCIMAYAMNEQPPMNCDSYDPAFFCPTFTNTYAEKINRELREMNYDHPRSSQQEPLYAEIFN